MAGVADQQHVAPFARKAGDLHVHLRDQRAGGVEDLQAAPLRFLLHGGRHAVGGENDGGPVGHFVQFFDEHRTQRAQAFDHRAVVHHLVTHVDGRAEQGDRALHDLNGPIDAGAEASGVGEQDTHASPPLTARGGRAAP